MDVSTAQHRNFGTLARKKRSDDDGHGETRPTSESTWETFVWTPSAELSHLLPENFEITIAAKGEYGHRQIWPSDGAKALQLGASLAGLAILESTGRLSVEHRGIYDKMRFLFQVGWRRRERIGVRKSLTEDELYVRKSDALGPNADILPDDFGLTHDRAGKRWTVGQLMAEGRREALNCGIAEPSKQEQIYYGIDAESETRPNDVTGNTVAQIRNFLRFVSFDMGPSNSEVDDELKARVFGRLFDAFRNHLHDETDIFDRWFFSNFNGIVFQISNHKKPDGKIPRECVRQAIIELAFDSWAYVGQTVDVFMQSVADAVEPPLTTGERSTFDAMYKCNPQMGNLPLFLFFMQFPVAEPAVLRILTDPNDPIVWGRFHRVLQTYGTMVSRRRLADNKKKKSIGRNRTIDLEHDLASGNDQSIIGDMSILEIAQAFLIKQDFKCKCRTELDWKVQVAQNPESPESVTFAVTCRGCGCDEKTKVNFNDLKVFANNYREEYI